MTKEEFEAEIAKAGPLGVQAIWAIFWIELAVYWAHRLLHRVPLFWHFHKIHHSSLRLDWIQYNYRIQYPTTYYL